MLVVFCENFPEISLSFMVGGSKLIFFVGQILNSIILFILERSEYTGPVWFTYSTSSTHFPRKESSMHGVLNEVYLQKPFHGWV